jgi:ferric-dicitrate binding protein FerR (iron transport regulator)
LVGGSVGLQLGHGKRKKARLTDGARSSATQGRKGAWRQQLPGPAHADARDSEEKQRLGSAWPKGKRERREQDSAKRASRPPGRTGKAFLFSFFFSFLI